MTSNDWIAKDEETFVARLQQERDDARAEVRRLQQGLHTLKRGFSLEDGEVVAWSDIAALLAAPAPPAQET